MFGQSSIRSLGIQEGDDRPRRGLAGPLLAICPNRSASSACEGGVERPRLHPKVRAVRLSTNTMSIREQLYPQEQELSVLMRHCSDARYVWNLVLEQRNSWRRGRSQKITTHS